MNNYERVALTKDRLREAMRDAGMTQSDLARATGLNRATISRYLSGEVEPRQDAAHKLAIALGVAEFWLWGHDVPRDRTDGQKKNDDLVQVIAKLRSDPGFFEVVSILAGLPPAEYDSIKLLLSRLGEQ